MLSKGFKFREDGLPDIEEGDMVAEHWGNLFFMLE